MQEVVSERFFPIAFSVKIRNLNSILLKFEEKPEKRQTKQEISINQKI